MRLETDLDYTLVAGLLHRLAAGFYSFRCSSVLGGLAHQKLGVEPCCLGAGGFVTGRILDLQWKFCDSGIDAGTLALSEQKVVDRLAAQEGTRETVVKQSPGFADDTRKRAGLRG